VVEEAQSPNAAAAASSHRAHSNLRDPVRGDWDHRHGAERFRQRSC